MATKITDLRQYWLASPERQIRTLQTFQANELEAYARANKLIVHNGKAIPPANYPCKCYLQSPLDCQNDKALLGIRKDYKPGLGQCDCPCHTYYEPA